MKKYILSGCVISCLIILHPVASQSCDIDPSLQNYYTVSNSGSFSCPIAARAACESDHGCGACSSYETGPDYVYKWYGHFEPGTYPDPQTVYVYAYCGDQQGCSANACTDCTPEGQSCEPDGDGDGRPDDSDPCPDNPDPNCTDDPPGQDCGNGSCEGSKGETKTTCPADCTVPDDIEIGDCVIDITQFKIWLLSPDAFPFNIAFAVLNTLSPLFDATPEAPVWQISVNPSGGLAFETTIDFTPYDGYAALIRWAQGIVVIFSFAVYGLKRYRNIHGVGGD